MKKVFHIEPRMYLLIYYRKGILFDLVSSEIGRLNEYILHNDVDPVCICQDWDYELVWIDLNFNEETARNLLLNHLNEKINGPDTIKWDNWKF